MMCGSTSGSRIKSTLPGYRGRTTERAGDDRGAYRCGAVECSRWGVMRYVMVASPSYTSRADPHPVRHVAVGGRGDGPLHPELEPPLTRRHASSYRLIY